MIRSKKRLWPRLFYNIKDKKGIVMEVVIWGLTKTDIIFISIGLVIIFFLIDIKIINGNTQILLRKALSDIYINIESIEKMIDLEVHTKEKDERRLRTMLSEDYGI